MSTANLKKASLPLVFFVLLTFGCLFWPDSKPVSAELSTNWFECSVDDPANEAKFLLPGVYEGQQYKQNPDMWIAGIEEVNELWLLAGVSGVKCKAVTYPDVKNCDTATSDCPSGYKCDLGAKLCVKINCQTHYDCDPMANDQNNVDAEIICKNGDCVVMANAKLNEGCSCPHNNFSCVTSPMCGGFQDVGDCSGHKCTSKVNQGGSGISSCLIDKECWDNDFVKCCEGGQCVGDISNCKDLYLDENRCPPHYNKTDKGCVQGACPIQPDDECNTDEDCKKGGQDKFCVELTKNTPGIGLQELVTLCKEQSITKSCEFKSTPVTPLTPPADGFAPAPFVLPSIAGLNQLGSTDVKKIIGNVIWKLMGVMGSIALALFVYAGVIMMIGSTSVSGGATKKDVLKAKAIMVWAVLGMFVIFASYAIVKFIFSTFS